MRRQKIPRNERCKMKMSSNEECKCLTERDIYVCVCKCRVRMIGTDEVTSMYRLTESFPGLMDECKMKTNKMNEMQSPMREACSRGKA